MEIHLPIPTRFVVQEHARTLILPESLIRPTFIVNDFFFENPFYLNEFLTKLLPCFQIFLQILQFLYYKRNTTIASNRIFSEVYCHPLARILLMENDKLFQMKIIFFNNFLFYQ